MDNNTLRRKIKELQPWYQEIKFNDEVTAKSKHSKWSGEVAWNYIDQLLPDDLEGKRVLDLGSNGGLFLARCAQKGAKEVVGIEMHGPHIQQANFVKNYYGLDNIKIVNGKIEEVPNMDLGKFDVVLAIAVLYWIGRDNVVRRGHHYDKRFRDKEIKTIGQLAKLSDCFIVRGRGGQYNNDEYYNPIFESLGFTTAKVIHESESNRVIMKYIKED